MAASDDIDSLRLQGNAHFAAGRFRESLSPYSAALLLLTPDHSELRGTLLSNRSAAHLALCDVPAARADAEGATAARPTWHRAWQRLGRAAWAARDAAAAREAFARGAACEGGGALASDAAAAEDALRGQALLGVSGEDSGEVCFTLRSLHSLASLAWLPPDAARVARATPGTLPGPPSAAWLQEELRSLAPLPPTHFDYLEWHYWRRAALEEYTEAGGEESKGQANSMQRTLLRMTGMLGKVAGEGDVLAAARCWNHVAGALRGGGTGTTAAPSPPPFPLALRTHALDLTVRLLCSRPPVWRRLRVPAALPLNDLALRVLTPVLAWAPGLHTYVFHLPPSAYPGQRLPPWSKDVCIAPRANLSDRGDAQGGGGGGGIGSFTVDLSWLTMQRGGSRVLPAEGLGVGEVLRQRGDSLHYTYDLGDKLMWEIVVEDAHAPCTSERTPVLVLGGGAPLFPRTRGHLWSTPSAWLPLRAAARLHARPCTAFSRPPTGPCWRMPLETLTLRTLTSKQRRSAWIRPCGSWRPLLPRRCLRGRKGGQRGARGRLLRRPCCRSLRPPA